MSSDDPRDRELLEGVVGPVRSRQTPPLPTRVPPKAGPVVHRIVRPAPNPNAPLVRVPGRALPEGKCWIGGCGTKAAQRYLRQQQALKDKAARKASAAVFVDAVAAVDALTEPTE